MRVRIPIAMTLAAVMAVTSLGFERAAAAPAAPVPADHQSAANEAQPIEVASKKKRHRGNNAAAAAAFAGIAGAMIGLAIQESQRDRYYRRGGYYYYGDGPYYGGRTHYRGRTEYRARHHVAPPPGRYSGNNHRYRWGLESPHPQNYGPGEHPPIQNWGQDR